MYLFNFIHLEQTNEEEQSYKNMIEEYISKSYSDNEEQRFQKTSELLEKFLIFIGHIKK